MERSFAGLDLVDPSVVLVNHWTPAADSLAVSAPWSTYTTASPASVRAGVRGAFGEVGVECGRGVRVDGAFHGLGAFGGVAQGSVAAVLAA